MMHIRFLAFALFSMLFILACTQQPSILKTGLPPANPYLAQVYNNQGHWNDAGTDSTAISVPRGHYAITPTGYSIVPNDGLGIPAYTAEVKGERIHWFFAGASMRKLHWEDGIFKEIDRQNLALPLDDFQYVDAKTRLDQAKDIQVILEQKDEKALADYLKNTPNRLLSAVEDQVKTGILYSLFTRDHALIGSNARGLIRIANENPDDPFSKLSPAVTTRLPSRIFDDAKVARLTIFPTDVVFGLSMTFPITDVNIITLY